MIENVLKKVKEFAKENARDLYVAAIIFMVGVSSFGLGRLSVLWPKKEPIRVEERKPETLETGLPAGSKNPGNNLGANVKNSIKRTLAGKYVASKSGSAYHFPWCPGAQRIKEENKIWFDSKEEAESRGYKPAGNCEGL